MVLTDQVITGRYQLGRLLGSGGFGAVYLAEDLRLQRPVAIKVCSTRRLPPDEAAEAARLFEGEALTLARLRHSGLTAVWDYFHEGDDYYLVMEYIPGETLRDLLARSGGRLPVSQAIDYTSQLCDVLGYLHTRSEPVVFRDLKPANIMVTPTGELKLIDFGIARLFSPGKTSDTTQFGTPGYAPPEQYGGQTEPRSDIYSLAAVTHQMLTGHNPTASPFALPPARVVNPALSPEIEAALSRALAPQPADRFSRVEDFCAALRLGNGPTATGPTVPINTPRPAPPRRTDPLNAPLWTPAPRALPERPHQAGGVRVAVLLTLIFILVASLAAGGWLLRDAAAELLGTIRTAAAPAPAPGLELEGLVAYVAPGPGGGKDLFIRSGSNVERLTNYPTGVEAALPAIAPDRTRIAYGEYKGPGKETLWLINRDGSGRRRLLDQYAVARAPSWSPDGRRLAVEVARPGQANNDIVEVDVASGAVLRPLADSPAWEGGPDWAPDGRRIAFHSKGSGSPCMLIYILDIEAGTPAQRTFPPSSEECQQGGGDLWPVWSPDGQRIAFGHKFGGAEHVAVMDVATGEVVKWETSADPAKPSPAGHPSWSPDGNYLLFEEEAPGKDADGQETTITKLFRLDLNPERRKVEPLDARNIGGLSDWR